MPSSENPTTKARINKSGVKSCMIQTYLQTLTGEFEVHSGSEIGRQEVESGVIRWLHQVRTIEEGNFMLIDSFVVR